MVHIDLNSPAFKQKIDTDVFHLLDVRTAEEFNAGHLKGATNIDFYQESFEDNIDELNKGKKYLVYCKSGGRSRKAMFMMRELGFEEVYNLSGGIISWNEHGFEIEK